MGSGRSVAESLGQLVHGQLVYRQLLLTESVAAWAAAGSTSTSFIDATTIPSAWADVGADRVFGLAGHPG